MKVVKSYPPNIDDIQRVLKPQHDALYCYGDTIHNPSGQEILADVEEHERIHSIQQKSFQSPDMWWRKYLLDPEFRKSQEAEAYNAQWNFLKKHGVPTKITDMVLNEMSETLSSPMYGLGINKHQAKTLIRKYG